MTTIDIGRAAIAAPEVRSFGLLGWVARLFKRFVQHRRHRAVLYELSGMSAYMLRDMGIEPRDIYDTLDGKRSSVLLEPMRKD